MKLTEEFTREMTKTCFASAEKYEKKLHITIPQDIIDNNISKLANILEKIKVAEEGKPFRYKYESLQDEEEILQNVANTEGNKTRMPLSKRMTDHMGQIMNAYYFENAGEAQQCLLADITGDGILLRRISNITARLCSTVEMGAPNIIIQNEIRMLFEVTLLLTLTTMGDISLSEAEHIYWEKWENPDTKPINHAKDRIKELERALAENDVQKYEAVIANLNTQIAALKKAIESERAQSAAKMAKLDKENRQLDHKIDELVKTIDRMTIAGKQ